jgi:hypothetical protein
MISTVLFDINDVLCRYNREVRVARLARDCAKTSSFVEDAIWASGYEDLRDAGAMDIDGLPQRLRRAPGRDFDVRRMDRRLAGRADAAPGSLGQRRSGVGLGSPF